MVLDDIWDSWVLKAFDNQCQVLITSRDRSVTDAVSGKEQFLILHYKLWLCMYAVWFCELLKESDRTYVCQFAHKWQSFRRLFSKTLCSYMKYMLNVVLKVQHLHWRVQWFSTGYISLCDAAAVKLITVWRSHCYDMHIMLFFFHNENLRFTYTIFLLFLVICLVLRIKYFAPDFYQKIILISTAFKKIFFIFSLCFCV